GALSSPLGSADLHPASASTAAINTAPARLMDLPPPPAQSEEECVRKIYTPAHHSRAPAPGQGHPPGSPRAAHVESSDRRGYRGLSGRAVFLDGSAKGPYREPWPVAPPDDLDGTAPMADRTYRWLLISLAVFGLIADQTSKYGVFHWLYKDGQFADATHTGNV